jgi:hypothetical protein
MPVVIYAGDRHVGFVAVDEAVPEFGNPGAVGFCLFQPKPRAF